MAIVHRRRSGVYGGLHVRLRVCGWGGIDGEASLGPSAVALGRLVWLTLSTRKEEGGGDRRTRHRCDQERRAASRSSHGVPHDSTAQETSSAVPPSQAWAPSGHAT